MRIYRIRKFPARLFIAILIITIVVFKPKFLSGLKNFAFNVLSGPFEAFSGVKAYFARVKDLSEENLSLKQKLATLSVELSRMKQSSLENERLHDLLGFKKNLRCKSIVAKVTGRDSVDWRRSVIINRGARDGIKPRMPCATAKGLIGSVAEVGPDWSKVMLITDPDSRIGVILEPSRESGVLIGSPEGNSRVIYLSLDSEIKRGDRVMTAGFSAFFPKGLAIGEVREVGVERTGLYKYARMEPFEDTAKIEEVVCIETQK